MSQQKHNIYLCKDCNLDFIVYASRYFNLHNPFCPRCGERLFVELVKGIWKDRPFLHNRRYTQEEDEIIIESRKRGMYVSEIEIEGRTLPSVYGRWSKLREKGLTM